MRKIAVLVSTGSIGRNGLKVISHLKDQLSLHTLAAGGGNLDLLTQQIKEYNPKKVSVHNKEKAKELKLRFPKLEVVSGVEGTIEVATEPEVDVVLCGIVGNAGLLPTIEAIKAKKIIALANKEVLVSAGHLVMKLVKEYGVSLIPVDSEHSALFQCMQGQDLSSIRRVILTASGGPFRKLNYEELKNVTLSDALNHPTWTMGAKVTIDSSTLMNKGLEVIEAHWLFSISPSSIDVVIHPQSVIHSLVEYQDLSVLAQMGEPTMITPIQYALTFPERSPSLLQPIDLPTIGRLDFFTPDLKKFRCLSLAKESLKEKGSLPCYMNAANEVLVARFINKEISWIEIGEKLETLMENHTIEKDPDLETIISVDLQARKEATKV